MVFFATNYTKGGVFVKMLVRMNQGIITHEILTKCDNSIFSIHLDVHLNLDDWGFIIKHPR